MKTVWQRALCRRPIHFHGTRFSEVSLHKIHAGKKSKHLLFCEVPTGPNFVGLKTFVTSIGLLFAVGCTNIRVARPDHWNPQIDGVKTNYQAANDAFTVSWAATATQKTNICAFTGWSQLNIDPGNCATDGMSEVSIHRSFGDVLVEVLTIGICQRMTVEWRCAKPPQALDKDF